jgi:integrase
MKRKLTALFVESAKCPPDKDRVYFWDASEPGFGLMVTAKGAKSWVIQYRHDGKAKRVTRKDFPPLAQARADARDALTKTKRGEDPHATVATETVADVCNSFLRLDGRKLRSRDHYRRLLERLVFPVIGGKPVGAVKKSMIVKMLNDIKAKKGGAKHNEGGEAMGKITFAVLSRILNWHAANSDDFTSPIVRGMASKTDVDGSRTRILSADELRSVWATCRLSDPFGAYVKFVLLTASRRMEAAAMRWDELDGDLWIIPGSRYKTKREHVVPLSNEALAVLANLPKIGPGRYVFTLNGETAMGGISNRKAAFDQQCGVMDWTLHDLRRTARTLMSKSGVPPYVAEKCLGHVVGAIERTYDRYAYLDEKRSAFDKLAKQVSSIVGENVVAIRA